jgi:hypothetical protein
MRFLLVAALVLCGCGGVSEAPGDAGRAPDDSGAPPVADAGRVVVAPLPWCCDIDA